MHGLHRILQLPQLLGAQQTWQVGQLRPAIGAAQELPFGRAVRVTQRDPHQESVELRLGQGVGAGLVQRVLGGNHKKRHGQRMGFAVHTDLALFHCFQQGALGLGAGAVDLVCEQHLGEQGALVEYKALARARKDRHAAQVAGHQVGGELHPRKSQSKGARQGLRQRGLANAGDVLNQQVPPGQQAGDAGVNLLLLTHNHRLQLLTDRCN